LGIEKALFDVARLVLVANTKVDSFGRSEGVGSERRTNKHSVHDGYNLLYGEV